MSNATGTSAQNYNALLKPYREADTVRSILEIVVTVVPLVLLLVAMWVSLSYSYWLVLLFSVPAAGFLVRLFMIQHDCGHGAFFRRRSTNDWVGRVLGVVTLTPYQYWRDCHAAHHATSGNLDHRGIGDIDTLTVEEYKRLSKWARLRYRCYRHPLVMFGIGPAYLFLFRNRFPSGGLGATRKAWISVTGTNVAIAAAAAVAVYSIGLVPFLAIYAPVILIGASIGVWLFYVQHQFEDTFWARETDWTLPEAALLGSSYYDLPPVLRWMSANIGIHHVHHLNSRIPFYRLPAVLENVLSLRSTRRLTIAESVRCVRLALWDESTRKLVSFRHLRLQ